MRDSMEEILVKAHPVIFRDYKKSPRETCLAWGLECGDGWFAIIKELCKDVDEYCKDRPFVIVADQVKEKFGTLRFYYHTERSGGEDSDEDYRVIRDIVSKYERLSEVTCEVTGQPGTMHMRSPSGWIRTLSKEQAKIGGYVVVPKSQQL
tara:strand:- start:329 stop:778 length:450 start_codon:yes stop_codon:yes gene_type:complete